MKVVLLGEPLTVNHIWKHSCSRGRLHSHMTPIGKELKEDYQWQLVSQYRGEPLPKRLKLHVDVYFGSNRRRDIENAVKHAIDACTGYLWEDDSQIDDLRIIRKHDKDNPRLEFEVTTLV